MLDGLLGRGFSAKCKSYIKLIKTRIDVIRRKRNAMQKYLKKDMADLLKNGLDSNAYSRADGLLVELSLSSSYDLIEQFCGSIPRHLSVMQKQSECPGECREAVASVIFAAARFSDLPELRDLRQLFTDKYGNSLEPFVKPEFAENLALNPPTKEMKLQLMRDIAKEFSVKWDSKDFEQKISNPPTSIQDRLNLHGPVHVSRNDIVQTVGLPPQNDTPQTFVKRNKEANSAHGRREPTDMSYKAQTIAAEETVVKRNKQDFSSHGRREIAYDAFKPQASKEVTVVKGEDGELRSRGRQEHIKGHQIHNVMEETVLKRDNHDVLTQGRREFVDNGLKPSNARDDAVLGRRNFLDGHETISRREDRGARREFTDNGVLQKNISDSSHGKGERINGHHIQYGVEETVLKRDNRDALTQGRRELVDNGLKLSNARDDAVLGRRNFVDGHESILRRENRGATREFTDNRVLQKNIGDSSHGKGERMYGHHIQNGEEESMLKRDNRVALTQGRRDYIDNGFKPRNARDDAVLSRGNFIDGNETKMRKEDRGARREFAGNGFGRDGRTDSVLQKDNIADSSHGKREQFDDGDRLQSRKEPHRRDNHHISSNGRSENSRTECTDNTFAGEEDIQHKRYHKHISSDNRHEQAKVESRANVYAGKEAEKITSHESVKPPSRSFAPPPYVKPSNGKYGTRNVFPAESETIKDPTVHIGDFSDRSEKTHYDRQEFEQAKMNDHRYEKPKPRSMRRHSKAPPSYEHRTSTADDEEVATRRIHNGRRREVHQAFDEVNRGLKDEEEQEMDQLLMHYSKKPSKYEPSKVKAGLISKPSAPPFPQDAAEWHQESRNTLRSNLESSHLPFRSVSLPSEPATPTSHRARGPPVRAGSLQPERVNVHPNLPEYDDLAARLANLRRG